MEKQQVTFNKYKCQQPISLKTPHLVKHIRCHYLQEVNTRWQQMEKKKTAAFGFTAVPLLIQHPIQSVRNTWFDTFTNDVWSDSLFIERLCMCYPRGRGHDFTDLCSCVHLFFYLGIFELSCTVLMLIAAVCRLEPLLSLEMMLSKAWNRSN